MGRTNRIADLIDTKLNKEHVIARKDLASRLDITTTAVGKWLKGGSIAMEKIPELCRCLEITPNELFGFDDTTLTNEQKELLKAYEAHPEFHESVKTLLNFK